MSDNAIFFTEHETYLQELESLHRNGAISDSEYKDLLEDVRRNVELQEATDTIVLKANILKAIDSILTIL